jgi:chromosome partitioning protein
MYIIMTLKIGALSQKGGVGKSTISRTLAVEYSRAGFDVLVADMDVSQGTSFNWNSTRMKNEIEPYVAIQQFQGTNHVLKNEGKYDVIIFDGQPTSSRQTEQIAQISDLILLPTGAGKDDLDPQIKLAHEFVKKGISKDRILFFLSRARASERESKEAVDYLKMTGYNVLDNSIEDKTGYGDALDNGKSLTETRFKALNEKAEYVIQLIVNEVEKLTPVSS